MDNVYNRVNFVRTIFYVLIGLSFIRDFFRFREGNKRLHSRLDVLLHIREKFMVIIESCRKKKLKNH